jgi:hypothetical protein
MIMPPKPGKRMFNRFGFMVRIDGAVCHSSKLCRQPTPLHRLSRRPIGPTMFAPTRTRR